MCKDGDICKKDPLFTRKVDLTIKKVEQHTLRCPVGIWSGGVPRLAPVQIGRAVAKGLALTTTSPRDLGSSFSVRAFTLHRPKGNSTKL